MLRVSTSCKLKAIDKSREYYEKLNYFILDLDHCLSLIIMKIYLRNLTQTVIIFKIVSTVKTWMFSRFLFRSNCLVARFNVFDISIIQLIYIKKTDFVLIKSVSSIKIKNKSKTSFGKKHIQIGINVPAKVFRNARRHE